MALSGFAGSYWEKDAAESAVKRVYGVKGVANDIQVKTSGETDPEIARIGLTADKMFFSPWERFLRKRWGIG